MSCAVLIHLLALHTASGLETFTPGLGGLCGGETPIGLVEVGGGVLRNSYGDTSKHVEIGVLPFKLGERVQLGAFVGAIDGYQNLNRGGWTPFGGLQARVDLGGLGTWRLELVPKTRQTKGWMLGLALEF